MLRLSSEEALAQVEAGGAGREAILNPVSSGETFLNTLNVAASGLSENVTNLTRNTADMFLFGEDSNLAKQSGKVKFTGFKKREIPFSDEKIQLPDALETAIAVAKLPFSDFDPKNGNIVEDWRKSALKKKSELAAKGELGHQYSGGGFGTAAGELVKALPIFKFGTMSRATAAINADKGALEIAKAVSVDTIRNIGSMGASEIALSKAYGESDKEALEKGATAGLVAGLGTPIVGAAKGGIRALGSEERALRKNFEEGGSMAGGGKPPETTDRKTMQNVKVETGKELPDQKEVKTPKVKKFDETFDDERGRNYAKSWLNSHQGKSTDKASTIRLPEHEITNVGNYIKDMERTFKSHIDTIETYGGTDTKFKKKGSMTASEKKVSEVEFQKDLMFKLSKDKRITIRERRELRDKASVLNDKIKKLEKTTYDIKAKIDTESTIAFKGQKLKLKTPDDYNKESDSQFKVWRERNTGYDKGTHTGFEKDFDAKSKEEQASSLISVVKAKQDKEVFLETLDKIQTAEKLKGKDFDVNNISKEHRDTYQSEIYKITDFIERSNDIKLLDEGIISPREFSFRESKRLDADTKRDGIIGNKFESDEDLAKAILENEQKYINIGLRKPKMNLKPKNRSASDDEKINQEDKTDYDKLNKTRSHKLNAMSAYRKGNIYRVKSGDRTGEPVLTEAQMRDIDNYGEFLTDEQILAKTQPNVADSVKNEATQKARESAKRTIKSKIYKKLGIDVSLIKPQIKFTQTIIDVKNSMGQIGAVLTGSDSFAKQVFVKGDDKEFRVLLADKMSERLGIKLGKKEIKTPVMITGYGSQKKGTMKAIMEENDWIKTEAQASEFMDVFYEEFAKLAPELSDLMDSLRKVHETRTNPVYEWTMPDGFKVKFDLSEYKDYVVTDGKSSGIASVRTAKVDKMSRALLPNMFHSIDGYIARQMRKRMNIQTTHDAWHIPAGREAEGQQVYRDILKEINEMNLADDILQQIGYKPGFKKSGKLSDDMFSSERELLDSEHVAGVPERAEGSKQTPTKQMTESEVMREFMTQASHRNHQYFKMVDGMIDEAVQSTHNLGVAREADDVYERALAYALQGHQYGKAQKIAPPNDRVDSVKWYSEQDAIFKEFRAKAEFNPDLKDSVLGERKYFTIDGEPIGATIKSKRKIRAEVEKKIKTEVYQANKGGIDISVQKPKEIRKDNLETKAKIIDGKVPEVTEIDLRKLETEQSYAPNPKAEWLTKEQIVDSAKPKAYSKSWVKQSFDDVMFHLKSKYKDTKDYQQYQKLIGVVKNPQKDAEQAGDNLKTYIDVLLKGENQKEWTKHLFETDARVLREFKNKAEADAFMRDNQDLYIKSKPAVDQLSIAIAREENQVGAFLNNAKAIAEHYNIPASRVDDLDKIISIKAMDKNDSWKFFETNKGSERFEALMDIADAQYNRSTAHFMHEKSMNKQVKGYLSEHYDGGKTITEDGKVIWDAESKFEEGALGLDLTQNKVGKMADEEIDTNAFNSEAEMIAFALKNNLKITDKGWRKIPSAKIKDEAGRSKSLADRLGTTEASIQKKTAQFDSTIKILQEEGQYDKLFSKEPKDDFIKISPDQLDKMPYAMKGEVNYINPKYVEKLLGRDEVRFFSGESPQSLKVADKLVENLVTMFKQNVVLKNPASYKNAILVNFTTNALVDGNMIRAARNAKKAGDVFGEYNDLVRKHDIARAKGETEIYSIYDHRAGKVVQKKRIKYSKDLEENEVQKYLGLGLSINTLDGVRGKSSLLSYIASDKTGNRLDKIGNEILMNQRGNTGNITKSVFSFIDFQGRYMAIKSLEAKGMSSADAVRKANDLFGQMDDMAPQFIQIIDKYGMFVFSKWLASVAPATMRASKDNPKKALALTAGLYWASSETDVMLSNISPIEGVVDMVESGASGESFIWDKKLQPFILPGVYKDMWKQSAYYADDTQHWHKPPAILWKNRLEPFTDKDGVEHDYRGITQKSIDTILKD